MSRIEEIIGQIQKLEKELVTEIQKKEEEFLYRIKGKKVIFEEEARAYQKQFFVRVSSYFKSLPLLNLLTIPFIWGCLIPAVFMDITVTLYQLICFSLYGIPQVKRSEYMVIDRHALAYLNIIEKINCMYCGYFNGLIGYVQEIAARTEQYWCPIKHARKVATMHSRYHKFIEYGDAKSYQERLQALRRDWDDVNEEA
ncbi:hypothetical protein JWJ90_07530 [Desulfobulbus rhabdoformis]|uniref:hypothetical protein n=1 Tax=Desulfobulbus rhabdoformis TaxID=34032 RepID=UPI0019629081|nr:hypothetical protein [Desulfobulbus rhabdoformis]MBM9614137.1 hypothetical protein [Desulfobulbus rhabdoformis]